MDEQLTDIPRCSLCGKRPKYWSLYPTVVVPERGGRMWIWFISNDYIASSTHGRFVYNGCYDLDVIKSVRCRAFDFDLHTGVRHTFNEGDIMFNAVMRVARSLEK